MSMSLLSQLAKFRHQCIFINLLRLQEHIDLCLNQILEIPMRGYFQHKLIAIQPNAATRTP